MKKPRIAFFTNGFDFCDYWLDSMRIHAPALSRAHFLRVEKLDQLHLDAYEIIIFFLTEYEYGELVFDIELLIKANSLEQKGAKVFFVNKTACVSVSASAEDYRVSRISYGKLDIDQIENHSVIPEVFYQFLHMDGKCRIAQSDDGNSFKTVDWAKLYEYIMFYCK